MANVNPEPNNAKLAGSGTGATEPKFKESATDEVR